MREVYPYFLLNSDLRSIAEARVPLSRVEYSYGFGVYENIRVTKGKLYFADEHCTRLMESARIIGLEHRFTSNEILKGLDRLIAKNQADSCNIKILLIGGNTAAEATLYALCLNPLFPDRKLYKTGAKAITYKYERLFPHAKSLNMLPSYLAYREARRADAYDALLINRQGCITEGTRTNFFALKDQTIYSPPESEILLGVTRDKLLQVARQAGFEIKEKELPLTEIDRYDYAFITSTSSKIMPLRSIDEYEWPEIPEALKKLMTAFDDFLRII